MHKVSPVAEQPPIPESPGAATFTRTTLGEWGHRLPVGVLYEGQLHKEFALRRWTTVQERQIETVRKEKKGLSQPDFVVEVLSRMLTRLGPYDFEVASDSEKRVILQTLWMADVMVLWACLRIKALGNQTRFKLDCEGCRAELRPEVDLNETDLKVVDDPKQLVWGHTLRDGIMVGGVLQKELLLQPPRWSILVGTKNRKTMVSDLKVSVAIGSIRQIGDGKALPNKTDLDEMEKYDIEHLQRTVDDHAPGIEMEFQTECDRCGRWNHYGFDWTFDFFFTASSL